MSAAGWTVGEATRTLSGSVADWVTITVGDYKLFIEPNAARRMANALMLSAQAVERGNARLKGGAA
jgi:hypothetical protein